MSTLQVSRLESLILDKARSLEYVAKAGYSDDGRTVTILAIHNDDRERDSAILRGIGDMGTEIEDEMADRVVVTMSIQDGPDLPEGMLHGRRVVYEREAGR